MSLADAAFVRGAATKLGIEAMQSPLLSRNLAVAIALALFTAFPPTARADIADYAFRLVEAEIEQGDGAIVSVQLIDTRSGRRVPDAVIFAARLDMAPSGMPEMTAPLDSLLSLEPGVYRFRTDLTMTGDWRLSLAAKIQNEIGTLEGRLVLQAVP